MEEWHTLTHDIELLTHPETPVFKEGQVPSEAELHELLRLRRMERQPDLAAQLDEIANWLYDLLGKKGEKDVKGVVRATNNRCNDWFKVLQRRWPQHCRGARHTTLQSDELQPCDAPLSRGHVCRSG